jgi:hypothetical protein
MLEALIDGQRDPAQLAKLAKRRLRSKIPALTEALSGRFRRTTPSSWLACTWTRSTNTPKRSRNSPTGSKW